MSISVVACASTSADGAIWTNSGASAATAPTPAKLTAATLRKSRRRTPSPVEPAVAGPSAGCALVAIIPLSDANSGVPVGTVGPHRGLTPERLGGLIARGFMVDKGLGGGPFIRVPS